MPLVLGLALYFVIWWTILFAVLPFGVRSQYEAGEVVPGTEGAAPERPMLLWKVLATSVLAAIIWGVVYLLMVEQLIPLDAFPGLKFEPVR